MPSPLVSVVIAVYNGTHTIQHALDSVAAQSYRDFEIVCVNDGSTDDTYKKLIEWQTEHSDIVMIVLQNEGNQGLAASLNRGLAAAKGNYIARLDADDQWLPEKLEKQMAYLADHPKCGVLGSFYINEKGSSRRPIRLPVENEKIKHTMFRRNPFGHSCVILQKKVINEVGGYNGNLREDRDLWFRLLHRTNFYNIPEFLVIRNIDSSHFVSSRELCRNIRTVHTYIRRYHASPINYVWLIEPCAVYLYHSLRSYALR